MRLRIVWHHPSLCGRVIDVVGREVARFDTLAAAEQYVIENGAPW